MMARVSAVERGSWLRAGILIPLSSVGPSLVDARQAGVQTGTPPLHTSPLVLCNATLPNCFPFLATLPFSHDNYLSCCMHQFSLSVRDLHVAKKMYLELSLKSFSMKPSKLCFTMVVVVYCMGVVVCCDAWALLQLCTLVRYLFI